MGLPTKIKTKNGPAYTSQQFKIICQQYYIDHVTGIEYNPQGQAVEKRVHHNLRYQIKKFKRRKKDGVMLLEWRLLSSPSAIMSQVLLLIFYIYYKGIFLPEQINIL